MRQRCPMLICIFTILWISACMTENDDEESTGTGDSQSVPLTPDNLFFVEQSVRTSYSYVDMWFAPPPELNAAGYTLQHSIDNRGSWQNFQRGGEDLTTAVFDNLSDANNFSIDIEQDAWLRLRITGGPHDGETSNEVWVVRCTTDVYVSSWSLDESMANTGVMAPQAGYGLFAAFTVTSYPESVALENVLTYQWYRVNPSDYSEMTPITGATSLDYTTTAADRGYRLLLRADGTGVDFNGFIQIFSTWIVR